MTICNIGYGKEGKCIELFPKYWNKGHFLMGNMLYVYEEDVLSQEELYMNKQLMNFVKDLGYPKGVIP